MDFYETSACTNLNIKEVRTPETAAWSLAEPRRGGGGEEMADRSLEKMGGALPPWAVADREGDTD